MAKRTTIAATKHHSAAARAGGKIAKRASKKTGGRSGAKPAAGAPSRAKAGKMVYYFGQTRTEAALK